MMRANKAFYAVVGTVALAAFIVFVFAAAALIRWKQHRAWKKVHSW